MSKNQAIPSQPRDSHEETINHANSEAVDDMGGKCILEDKKRDYTDVAAKTDPEEIRLVRKLDWRVMVRFLFQ
jgi:hypothetical protein